MGRRRLGALVVLVLAGAGAVTGCGDDRPDVDVQHRRIDAAPAKLSDAAPTPGGYARVWRQELTGVDQFTGYRLVAGQIVVGGRDGLRAYDARTGRPSWHFREPGRRMSGVAATGDAIVATFRDAGDTVKERHAVGLDAGTGELLWENTDEWDLTYEGREGSLSGAWADAADGTVAVAPDEDDERLGIDARSGDERWKLERSDLVDDDCVPKRGSADVRGGRGALLPVVFLCEQQDLPRLDRVFATVAPASGALAWGRRADTPGMGSGNARILTRGDVTLWRDAPDGPPALIGRDGRTFFRGASGTSCGATCALLPVGARALLTYERPRRGKTAVGHEAVSAVIDPRGGRVQPLDQLDASLGGTQVAAGGRLLSVEQTLDPRVGPALLPQGLATFDLASGRVQRTPLPHPGPYPGGPGSLPLRLLGAAGERLVVLEPRGQKGAVLASYAAEETGEPTVLGGVPPKDWPKACALLDGAPRGGHRGPITKPRPGPPLRVGGVTIREPSCGRFPTDVQVLWVASSAERAADLVPAGRPSPVGADAELPTDGGARTLRVGRVIVRVANYDQTDDAARAVVRQLRARD